jgi:electron transport complex protein RnfG
MKKISALIVSLTVIAGVCAAVLAYVDNITKGPIAEMQVKKANDAARAVMPEGVQSVLEDKDGGYYVGKDSAGKIVGYAVVGKDSGGYGGDIVLMVGFKADRSSIVCYKALQSSETPGLGTKLSSPEFSGQFAGKVVNSSLKVQADGGVIAAITSATITSRAVCRAIADAQKRLSNGK